MADLRVKDVTPGKAMKVAMGATTKGETIHNMPFEVAAQMVCGAIYAAKRGRRLSPSESYDGRATTGSCEYQCLMPFAATTQDQIVVLPNKIDSLSNSAALSVMNGTRLELAATN